MTDHEPADIVQERDNEVLLLVDDFGVLVQGRGDAAARAIDSLLETTSMIEPSPTRLPLSDVAAVGATGVALAASSGEYLRLTAESLVKVKEFGQQFDQAGAMRGYVRNGGKFAGQLSFEPVSLAAEQALALQTAAVSLALRSAIADVQKAVERVEGKVDAIKKHLDSRLEGDVVGTYRHLARVAQTTSTRGHLLEADWDSVASERAKIQRDLETMRRFVRKTAKKVDERLSLPAREELFKKFRRESGNVGDVLGLLLVAEQSLHLWEYLRLQRVRHQEPDYVSPALAEAQQTLRDQQEADASLVECLRDALERGRVVKPLEIHHVFARRTLDERVEDFDRRLQDFATSARAPQLAEMRAIAQPGVADARHEVGRIARSTGRAAKELCRDGVNRPGSGGGSQPMEDESHGSTQEVSRRAA